MYGEHLNSSGTDSQIFVAENLNVDVPQLVHTDGLKKFWFEAYLVLHEWISDAGVRISSSTAGVLLLSFLNLYAKSDTFSL